MNIEDLRLYALSLADVEECFPFGPETIVFKTKGKLFLLAGLDNQPLQFNAKCDPERALSLREEYSCITPGYHMNKKHWNTVIMDNTLSNAQIRELVAHSHELVWGGKKKTRG